MLDIYPRETIILALEFKALSDAALAPFSVQSPEKIKSLENTGLKSGSNDFVIVCWKVFKTAAFLSDGPSKTNANSIGFAFFIIS